MVVSFGRHIETVNDYYLHSVNSKYILERLDCIKDLGVTFDSKLKFDRHINDKVNKAYSILGLIHRNFRYLSSDSLVFTL